MAGAVVSGLLAGLWAGLAMLAYLMVAVWISGDAPVIILALFAPFDKPSPLTGALLNLAVSGTYGILYGLIWHWIPNPVHRASGWLVGLLYGMILLWVAKAVILPSPGIALTRIPLIHFSVAHLIYGLVVG